jgi:hypothetical protein
MTRNLWRVIGVQCLVLWLVTGATGASSQGEESEPQPKTRDASAPPTPGRVEPRASDAESGEARAVDAGIPIYVRPRGAAGGREGGGTRGAAAIDLVTLIPEDHAALTTREQPTLYWYLGEPSTARVNVIVSRAQDEQPLIEKTLDGPFPAGIHAVDFAELGVRLEPEIVYKFYVELVPDPARRSKNVFSGGTLQRTPPSAELRASLGSAGPGDRATAYAKSGIWCDALAEASARAAASPADASAQRQRAALLEQIGLRRVSGGASSPPADSK